MFDKPEASEPKIKPIFLVSKESSGSNFYNNFYEFGTGKNHPVERSQNFITDPWSITIDGEVKKFRNNVSLADSKFPKRITN